MAFLKMECLGKYEDENMEISCHRSIKRCGQTKFKVSYTVICTYNNLFSLDYESCRKAKKTMEKFNSEFLQQRSSKFVFIRRSNAPGIFIEFAIQDLVEIELEDRRKYSDREFEHGNIDLRSKQIEDILLEMCYGLKNMDIDEKIFEKIHKVKFGRYSHAYYVDVHEYPSRVNTR